MAQELHVGGDARNMCLGQRRIHARKCLLAGAAVDDQLGDHGVIKRADAVARPHTAVHAHGTRREAGAVRGSEYRQGADCGKKILLRVFGANARLNRMAADL